MNIYKITNIETGLSYNGTIKIMSGSGGSRHKDWIKLEKIENTNSDQISND